MTDHPFDAHYFDSHAATWDDDPAKLERSRLVADAIAAAVDLTRVADALEYGCGTGQVTFALGERLGPVVLADSSEGMLEVVRQRAASLSQDATRYETRRLDVMTEPLEASAFDLIYTAMALHHVPDVPRALAAFRTALRPGGVLAIADLDADPHGHFHGADFTGHHGFDRDALAADLQAAGFAAPQFETVTTLRKERAGQERDFDVFLATASVV